MYFLLLRYANAYDKKKTICLSSTKQEDSMTIIIGVIWCSTLRAIKRAIDDEK